MRRLAATLLLLAMLATLVVAARHNHFESLHGCDASACLFCSGAAAESPAAPALEPVQPPVGLITAAEPAGPVVRYLLPLDHSGCAPPAGAAPLCLL